MLYGSLIVNKLRVPCSVCDNALNGKYISVSKKVRIFSRCEICSHQESLFIKNEIYNDEYFNLKHRTWFTNPHFTLYEEISKYISQRDMVLDIGCGVGSFLKYIEKVSNFNENSTLDKLIDQPQLVGVDFYSKNLSTKYIQFIQGNIFDNDFGNKKFDFISCLAVLEEMDDPNRLMSLIFKLGSDTTQVIIMTVNSKSLIYKISWFLYHLGIREPVRKLYDNQNIMHFTKKSLTHLVEKHGFKIKTIIRFKPNIRSIEGIFYKIAFVLIACFEKLTSMDTLQAVILERK